jgi:predicted secreted protein
VLGTAIAAEMARHGFLEDQTRSAIKRLSLKRLIETPYLHYREIKVDESEEPLQFHFRASSVGIYHVRYWTGLFAFLDAISTDTPIFDDNVRSVVVQKAASFDIAERNIKTRAFRQYLESQWHAANIHCSYYNFANLIEAGAESFETVQTAVANKRQPRHMSRDRVNRWRGRA